MSEHESRSPMVEKVNKENKKKGSLTRLATATVAAVGLAVAADVAEKHFEDATKKDDAALSEARDRLKQLDAEDQTQAAENELVVDPLSGYLDYEDWEHHNPLAHPEEQQKAREYFQSHSQQ